MFGRKPGGDDPRPRSAVSHGVGVAGLIGLACWVLIARQYGMDGPYSALAACVACAIPMMIWSLLMDKVHLRPSTGIDWKNPKRLKETFDISLVKLTGLWATWGLIAVIYCVGRWYWTGQYQFSMAMMEAAAPWVFVLSIPYVLVMDRSNLADVRDIWNQNGGTEPRLFLEFGRSGHAEVPDPYYGGEDGFDRVLDLIEGGADGLLDALRERL